MSGRRRASAAMGDASATGNPRSGDPTNGCFVALDFETADHGRDSACALGLVKVAPGRPVERLYHLIRPPRPRILFTWVHGIAWAHVADQPTFAERWPEVEGFLAGADFLVAHNAPFDRGVLQACCQAAGVAAPAVPFFCSVQLSRRTWNLTSASLPNVCQFLGFSLQHHHAAADAEACAMIVLAAAKERGALGLPWQPLKPPRPTTRP